MMFLIDVYATPVVDVCSYMSSVSNNVSDSDGDDSSLLQHTHTNRSVMTGGLTIHATSSTASYVIFRWDIELVVSMVTNFNSSSHT